MHAFDPVGYKSSHHHACTGIKLTRGHDQNKEYIANHRTPIIAVVMTATIMIWNLVTLQMSNRPNY